MKTVLLLEDLPSISGLPMDEYLYRYLINIQSIDALSAV